MMLILNVLKQALTITILVFTMMLILDYANILSKGRMNSIIKGRHWRQYLVSPFLCSTPGCLGVFLNVSFYIHGLIIFGALVGGMIATSRDEAFVLLAMVPKQALLLFALLFVFGIVLGWLSDKRAGALKLKTCRECVLQTIHEIGSRYPPSLPSWHNYCVFTNESVFQLDMEKGKFCIQ